MFDDAGAAASPSSVYSVFRAHSRLAGWNRRPSKEGTGVEEPLKPQERGHIDIATINVSSTFYSLCSILDGCSRFIVHQEIHESMRESAVELVLERAREGAPEVSLRILSDNRPQLIAKDIKSYIRRVGMTHVRISPCCPHSNGKIERWHKSSNSESIRMLPPDSLEDARPVVERCVDHGNQHRLHSASPSSTPRTASMVASRPHLSHAGPEAGWGDPAGERRARVRRAARADTPKASQAVALPPAGHRPPAPHPELLPHAHQSPIHAEPVHGTALSSSAGPGGLAQTSFSCVVAPPHVERKGGR